MNIIALNRMSEMVRSRISIMNASGFTSFIDSFKPSNYELIVAVAIVIYGYDAIENTFKAPSLSFHYGTNVKFLCDIAKKITKNPVFYSSITINKKEREG